MSRVSVGVCVNVFVYTMCVCQYDNRHSANNSLTRRGSENLKSPTPKIRYLRRLNRREVQR